MSITAKGPGGRLSFKKKFVALAAALTLSGAAALVPFAVSAQQTNAALIAQLQAQIAALQTQLTALSVPSGTTSSAAQCSFTRSLTVGVRGDDVKCLQDYLKSTGHFTFSGGSTGYFGGVTRSAVAAWQAANNVSPAAGYFGSLSQAKYSSVAVAGTPSPAPTPTTPGAPPVVVVPAGSGLTVTASSDQPPSALSPLGATRVAFTKAIFTASADGDVVIKSIKAERQGAADDDAFDSIAIVDQDGGQIGISKTLDSIHQATFTEPITIKAGTSQTLTLSGTMLSSAPSSSNAGQVARLAFVSVAAGSTTVNGSFPIVGNGMTINESLTIGTVTMARGSLDPGSAQTKEVGTTAYIFSSIKVTAGSAEKVYLKSIRWNQTGSAGSGDLAKLKTSVDGVEYDLVVSSDGKYYTSTFKDNGGKGLLMDKGFSKDLSIRGDIAGGSARTIAFDVAKRVDIYLQGETYGFGLTPPQTNSCSGSTGVSCFTSGEDPWYDGAVVTISAGTMTVSTSNAISSQNIPVNLPNTPLGAFTVDVKGEDISVAKIPFNVTLGSEGTSADINDITNVTLVDEAGAIVAGPVDGGAADTSDTTSSGDGVIVFTSTVVFKPGIHTYKMLGKIGTDIGNNVTVIASTTPTDWGTVRGLTTGNTVTPSPSSAITLSTMTVRSGALAISVSSVPIAQTVIAGSKGFVYANYILDATASGEDVRLASIPLEYNNPSGGTAGNISNCQLFDGATSVTTGGNVKNPSAIASSTSFTFDGTGLTIPKGTSKTLALQCDLAGGSTGGYQWGVAANSTFTGATGLTSGQTISETFSTSAGQTMTASSGGTLTASLDANSPGYQVWYSGQTNVELARIRFSAANEDIDLKQVALQLGRTASNSPINLIGRKVTLWNLEGTKLGEATFSTEDYATSSVIASFRSLRDKSKILVVKGDLAAIGASGPNTHSGDFLTVDYDGNNTGINGNYGTGVSSGSTISPSGSDSASSGGRVFRSYPQFAYIPLVASDRVLISGTTANKPLYRFSVTAVGDDIAIAKFSFAVSSSTAPSNNPGITGATTSLFSLYSFSTSNFSTPDTTFSGDGLLNSGQCFNGRNSTAAGTANGTGNQLEIWMEKSAASCNTATTTYVVGVGQTRYFELRATVANVEGVSGTESFTVQLEGDSAFPTAFQGAGSGATAVGGGDMGRLGGAFAPLGVNAATDNDFIWSPVSTTTQNTVNDFDYTNGYLLNGLPPTNMTVETFTSTQ